MRVPLTPLDFIERARRQFAALEGVVDGDRRITYGEFVARCHRLAHALRGELGVEPGDRVAYLCGNTLELLEAYFGVVLAGGVLTPLNIRLAPAELAGIVADCRPKAVFVHPSFAGVLDGRPLDSSYEALLAAQPEALFDVAPFDEDDVCELFYTSGSTGGPKGAMLSHRALATHAVDSALTLGLHHRDVVLHTIPLFHVNGWGTPHYVTLLGARHVLLERFDAGKVIELVGAERVTRLSLVPTMATAILEHPDLGAADVSSVVQITVGGAPPTAEQLAALEDAFGCEVICGYGLTEAAPQLTKAVTLRSHDALAVADQRRRRATTGLSNIGVDLRVFDDADHEVPPDGVTVGEICVRSNHVMVGYWERPDETAEVLRGDWLRTGDLATVDAEGYVTIVDRRKDIIVSGGENISSVQVEAVLLSHPDVLEAGVIAMAHERWGEVPRGFVALRIGASVTGDELIALCARPAGPFQGATPDRRPRRTPQGRHREDPEEPPARMADMTTWTHTGYAQRIHFGVGAVANVASVVKELNGRRVLLVTTAGRLESDAGADLTRRLGRNLVATFSGVRSHVPTTAVQAAVALARNEAVDCVVSFGGGSCADLGKAVCFFREQEEAAPGTSYIDRPVIAHLAIPTTYSGAELTPFFGMTDEHTKRKQGAGGPTTAPLAAIYDPELTLDTPPDISAQTGMNALAHGIECAYSPTRSPEAEAIALACIERVAMALPIVFDEPGDIGARTVMLAGAVLGGRCLQNATMGVHHGLSQLIGGRTGMAHGLANGLILAHAMRFNRDAVPAELDRIGAALGDPDDAAAAVDRLRERVGLPSGLSDCGVDDDDIDAVARMAPGNPNVQNNPRPVSESDARSILEDAF